LAALLATPGRDNASLGQSTLLARFFQADYFWDKFTAGFMQGCLRDNPCINLTASVLQFDAEISPTSTLTIQRSTFNLQPSTFYLPSSTFRLLYPFHAASQFGPLEDIP
jgi:hypothetical protein